MSQCIVQVEILSLKHIIYHFSKDYMQLYACVTDGTKCHGYDKNELETKWVFQTCFTLKISNTDRKYP